jgi:heme-degrading monooxygenase HmoA/ketosteroid isomerase-like protein
MIARTWRGITPAAKADAYRVYLQRTGLKDYAGTEGNRGVLALRRIQGEQAEFLLVTLWESWEAIRRFAGEDVDTAVYYAEDDDFLLYREPRVTHYEVVDTLRLAGPGLAVADLDLIQRAYAAFNARDLDSALALLDPEVDWPNGLEGGRVRGREAVRAYWARQWTLIDPHVEACTFSADALGQIGVEVRQVVRDLNGQIIVDQMIQHVYRIQNGLIKGMEVRPPA